MADGEDRLHARFRVDRPGFCLDVDLQLPAHGVSALFGPSGSGKTTLLRCMAGLERAAGEFHVGGECWQGPGHWLAPHQRPIGYVFQEASLFPHLDVLGNLRFGQKRSPDASRVALEQAVDLLGIGHLLHRRPQQLSGGERQRVAIARALAVGPRLLLMDEPLAALDLARKREILPYLERLHAALAIPVVYVSHAPDEVARLADHLVVLEQGEVLAQGALAETLTRLDLPIRLGEDASAVVEAVVGEIDAEWQLLRVDFAGGSLWTRHPGQDAEMLLGAAVRIRVLARDVSLARFHPGESSIQNVLQGRVEALATDAHPALALVRVAVGGTALLARLTRRAATQLDIRPGQPVWVQVKSVALLD